MIEQDPLLPDSRPPEDATAETQEFVGLTLSQAVTTTAYLRDQLANSDPENAEIVSQIYGHLVDLNGALNSLGIETPKLPQTPIPEQPIQGLSPVRDSGLNIQ